MTGRAAAATALFVVTCMAAAVPALSQLETRTPTGGSNVTTRKCVGGADAGDKCNNDAQCDSNDCFDYNVIDLTVNFVLPGGGGWTPTAAQMTTIQGYLNPMSNTIADVTDGQVVLGTVSLVVNNGAPNAVVQLAAGTCNSGGGPCVTAADCAPGGCNGGGGLTNTGGWGTNGKIAVGVGCLQNPQCFAHEFMHLMANVRDEYEGALDDGLDNNADGTIDECQENQSDARCFGGTSNGQPCLTCNGGTRNGQPCGTTFGCPGGGTCTQVACPGGGTCRTITCIDPGPPAAPTSQPGCLMSCCLPNISSEMCWSGNHDPNQDTEQDQCRTGESCWTRFNNEWPTVIEIPPNGPTAGQVAPIGVGVLTPSVLDRFVAIIDRSASMDVETPRRIDAAVTATKDFVDLLANGVDFGLASFSSADGDPNPPGVDSTKDFPPEAGLRALNAGADRTAAKTAIDGLSGRTGGFTRIGAGLRQAQSMLLENGGQVTLNTSVLLLTDGINNRPDGSAQADLDAALQDLATAQIPVFVTCIGAARDSTQCSNIADQTAGRFVDSVTTENLYDAFVEFAASAQGMEVSGAALGVPIAQGEVSSPIPMLVEDGTASVRFVVGWTKSTSDLDLALFRPDGSQVPLGDRVFGSQGEFYVIDAPAPGLWTMQVTGTTVPDPERFSVRAIVEHRELNVSAGLAQATVQWPAPFIVSVSPTMGFPIAACETSVRIDKPDGTFETLLLRDDGRGADAQDDDGLYTEAFRNFTAGDGIYTFTVSVKCQAGVAHFHSHRDPGIGEFPVLPTLADFERVIRFSGTVTGVPANLPPTAVICADARVECEDSPSMLELDGSCSSDPEGGALSYAWSSPTCAIANPTAVTPKLLCPLGSHDVQLVVTDLSGNASPPGSAKAIAAACRLRLQDARLRRQQSPGNPDGIVLVRGTFVRHPGSPLTAADGITVSVEDELGFVLSHTWSSAECRTKSNGQITCRDAAGTRTVTFRPFPATPDVTRFTVRFRQVGTPRDLVFGGPVKMALSYPSSEADRIGRVDDCRTISTGLRCRQF